MTFTVDQLASHLEDILTWRQLRKIAKKNKLTQYSYLGKKQLAMVLAIQTFNKAQRNALPNPKQ
jgi:hypothetical protein